VNPHDYINNEDPHFDEADLKRAYGSNRGTPWLWVIPAFAGGALIALIALIAG